MEENKDRYVIAAIRHSLDGDFLAGQGRNHGAMGHYGFAMECFIKVLYKKISLQNGRKINHDMDRIYKEIGTYYRYICFEDVKTDILFKTDRLPEKLTDGHPERRYWDDICYTQEEMQEVSMLMERIREEIVGQVLDGRINIDD